MAQLNDLLVLGKSNLLGDTSIFGAFNINGDVLIDGTLTVNETALFKSSIEASGGATVGGAATIKGRLYANDGINLPNNKRIIQAQSSGSNYTTLVEWNWADKGSYSYYPQIGHHSNGADGNGALILMYAPSNTSPWTAANNHLYLSSNQLRWNNLIVMDSSRNFYPTSNGAGSIGTSSYYWNNGFLKNLTISTALTLNGVTYLNGNLVWKPAVNITCTPTAANQEFSIDVGSSSYTGSYFHIWSAVKSASILTCYPDDLSVKLAGATSIAGALTASSTALIKGSTEIQNNVKITNGNLTIHRDSTKANNTPAKIIFSNKQTDTPVTTNVAFIAAYDDQDANAYGQNLVIQGGSNIVIGAGESPSAFYEANLKTSSSEGLYLTSDGNIYLYPYCDTIANARGVIMDTSRQFYPILSAAGNAGALGTSNYRWSNAYIVNLNASGTGTITGNTSIGGTLSVGSTLTVGSTTLLKNTLTVNGNIHVNQSAGSGTGIGLYSTSAPTVYGIYFGTTGNFGKHGDVQGDWATYFGMNAVGTRGWVFRPGTTNVASISANGIGSFTGVGDGNAYMAFPKGGTLTIGSSGQKGYLTIVMPAGFSSTMVKFKVSVYNYSTGTSVDYIIGGYCYASDNKWYNPTVYCIGPRGSGLANLTVNFGMSGSNPAIQIGAASTSWEYPNIAISDVYLGHSRTYTNWAKSWTVSITTTAITSITQTVSNTYMGNFSGTDNKVAKFSNSGRTITNSNITDDGSTVTIGSKLVVQGNGTSFNEGIRVLPSPTNGWSNIFFSADTSTSGTHDGGWLVGRRGAAGTTAGAIGDFTIEEQSSVGANLTIHKNSGGATLQGTLNVRGNVTTKGTNPYVSFINSSGTTKGYIQYIESSDTYALGAGSANSLWVTALGSISIPASQSITPRTDNSGSVGTSDYEWKDGYFRNIRSGSTLYIGSASSTSIIFQQGTTEVARFNTSKNLALKSTGHGYFLVDSGGASYPGIHDNGSNLWIGSTATASTHHTGGTYISAGHNGTAGNTTIYVSVPNAANDGGSNYGVAHTGNVSFSAWTAGTTAGPKINLSVAGGTKTSAAIPSASTSASGIVTTGAQSFKGIKTFATGLAIPVVTTDPTSPVAGQIWINTST